MAQDRRSNKVLEAKYLKALALGWRHSLRRPHGSTIYLTETYPTSPSVSLCPAEANARPWIRPTVPQ